MKLFLIPAVFFLVFYLNARPLKADAEPGKSVFQEALRLREAGSLIEAERRLVQALEEAPGNPDFHFELANVYAAQYDRWGKHSSHPKAKVQLERAAREFEQAVMLRPDFLAAHYNLGVVYKRQGQFEKARERFKKVLELDDRSIQAWMQIGAAYEEQGFFEEAKDAYQEAQELDYFNPEIKGALQDLETRKQEARELRKAQAHASSSLRNMRSSFPYSAHGHAREYEKDRQASMQSAGGVQQALPYLAAMLMEQLINKRAESEIEE